MCLRKWRSAHEPILSGAVARIALNSAAVDFDRRRGDVSGLCRQRGCDHHASRCRCGGAERIAGNYTNAAQQLRAWQGKKARVAGDRRSGAASMFGNTTACIDRGTRSAGTAAAGRFWFSHATELAAGDAAARGEGAPGRLLDLTTPSSRSRCVAGFSAPGGKRSRSARQAHTRCARAWLGRYVHFGPRHRFPQYSSRLLMNGMRTYADAHQRRGESQNRGLMPKQRIGALDRPSCCCRCAGSRCWIRQKAGNFGIGG